MRLKRCFKCQRELPADDFYRHPRMGDGRLGKCKRCTKLDVRANYQRRRGQYLAYDRARSKTPKRRKQLAESKERYPVKEKSRQRLHTAIARGKAVRRPCEVCGNPRTDAHHDDYAKPLQVRWLCRLHHMRLHHEL